jgi:hypothetical protein
MLPIVSPIPAPKSPHLRLGSLHLVDTAPFQALTWSSIQGYATASPSADGNSGNMTINNFAGSDSNNLGSGSVSTWAAIGQAYTPPEDSWLIFTATPSFSWTALWMSTWWQEAAGDIWIGRVVNQFDSEGNYVATPISTQNSLESFNDYNLADTGNKNGSSSGFSLSTSLFVGGGDIYECWVWIGGDATGDMDNSYAWVVCNANVSSLVLDVY